MAVAADGIYMAGTSDYGAFLAKYDAAGNSLWNRTWSGSTVWGSDVAVDASGVYLAGHTYRLGENYDAFLAKYNTTGDSLWNRTWGGSGAEICQSVAVAADGVYMVGQTASFGGGYYDAFLAKYDIEGNLLWNRTWGIGETDVCEGIATWASEVYISGWSYNHLTSTSTAFLAKYSAAGAQLWNWTRTSWGRCSDVAVSADGIYLAGTNWSVNGPIAFLAKLDGVGNPIWYQAWSAGINASGYCVATANGGVYLAGEGCRVGEWASDAFFARYDTDGTQLWNVTLGGDNLDYCKGVAVASDGLYLAGTTYSYQTNGIDAFLLKYNGTGFIWPSISRPSDATFIIGEGGLHILSWIIYGNTSWNYFCEIFCNELLVSNGTWAVGTSITANLTSLAIGSYNFTIVASAGNGTSLNDTVTVTVLNRMPTISHPDDVRCAVGSSGNIIPWIITDASTSNSSYIIYQNGSVLMSGTWISSIPISQNVNGSTSGSYNYTIVAHDGYGGSVSDTVLVVVDLVDFSLVISILFVGLIAAIGIIAIVKLRPKLRPMSNRLKSMGKALQETAKARRQKPGKIEEILYQQPRAQPAPPAVRVCKWCGQPVPKGGEQGTFCIYCGKALG